jgi:hypothetical protein
MRLRRRVLLANHDQGSSLNFEVCSLGLFAAGASLEEAASIDVTFQNDLSGH